MTRRAWLILVVATALLGVVVSGTAITQLLVITGADGTELHAIPTEERTEVTIEYNHSVERSLVSDVYVISDGELVMDRMVFSSYGAGLPSGASVTQEGERYVYRPEDSRHETLVISTGPIAGHQLVVGGDRYDLVELADGGTISIHIETRGGV